MQAFGLRKSIVVTHGRDGRRYETQRYAAMADEVTKTNTTQIGCGAPTDEWPKSCQHRFLHRGRHIYFRHAPEDVANWRTMQQRVIDLLTTFEASATI